MIEPRVRRYLRNISGAYRRALASRVATPELSFRPYLDGLLKDCCSVLKPSDPVEVVFEPAKTQQGRPDFRLHDRRTYAVYGYIETKPVSDDPVSWRDHRDQLNRYLALGYPVVLTDGLEFLFFENRCDQGPQEGISLAVSKRELLRSGGSVDGASIGRLERRFRLFLSAKIQQRVARSRLMEMLAVRAALLRDDCVALMRSSFPRGFPEHRISTSLDGTFRLFKTRLDETLTVGTFSSAVAQILIFSLVVARQTLLSRSSARTVSPEDLLRHFSIGGARADLRPFRVLSSIVASAGSVLGPISAAWSEAALLLAYVDRDVSGLDDYHKAYEEFHRAYDPREKMDFGVYATPRELAGFIVKACETLLLKPEFEETSLYSEKVKIVDPGCGTGTFLERIADVSSSGLKRGRAAASPLVAGIEILPVPYALAHMRLDTLRSRGALAIEPSVLMGNSLSDPVVKGVPAKADGRVTAHAAALEAEFDDVIRAAQVPITVVLGNPPVSDKGFNMGREFRLIESALEDFRPPRKLRKGRMNLLKPLQNDCVKFLRWACLKVEESRGGVVAFVLPSSILTDRSYRYLRQYLRDEYDEIYVLNIDRDQRQTGHWRESLFRTQQGRAALIVVRHRVRTVATKPREARMFYSGLVGEANTRAEKIGWLLRESASGSPLARFSEFHQVGDLVPFVPAEGTERLRSALAQYRRFWPLERLFISRVSGVKTGCTGLIVHTDRERLLALLRDYANEHITDDVLRARFFQGQAKKGPYQRRPVRDRIASHLQRIHPEWIREYALRPFVNGVIYYDPNIMREVSGGRPRPELAGAFSPKTKNVGLAVAQSPSQLTEAVAPFAATVRSLSDNDLVSRGNAYVFPVLFPDNGGRLVNNIANDVRNFLSRLTKRKDAIEPEAQLVFYCYAILNSVSYLRRFREAIDRTSGFVRVPLTANRSLFEEVATAGRRLAAGAMGVAAPHVPLRLAGRLDVEVDRFRFEGSEIVALSSGRETFRIRGLSENATRYVANGYPVIREWLKRKTRPYLHRRFERQDLRELERIAGAVQLHIDMQPYLGTLVNRVLDNELFEPVDANVSSKVEARSARRKLGGKRKSRPKVKA